MLLLGITLHQQQTFTSTTRTLHSSSQHYINPIFLLSHTNYTMDFVKNAMGGNKDSSSKSSGGNQGTDYVDKGMIHSPSDSTYHLTFTDTHQPFPP